MTRRIIVRALQTCFCADQKRHREGSVFLIPDVSHFSENGMEFVDDASGKLQAEFEAFKADSVAKSPAAKAAALAEAKKHDKKFPAYEKAVKAQSEKVSDQDVI